MPNKKGKYSTRPFWKHVKECGDLYSSSKDKAELIIKQLKSVFTKDDGSQPPISGDPAEEVIIITNEGVTQ